MAGLGAGSGSGGQWQVAGLTARIERLDRKLDENIGQFAVYGFVWSRRDVRGMDCIA